ncbi:TorF family putative porin [Brevundimonas sp. DC300-4]|uniref:TorF family putative porin n=1 Tax=Brevundimonas sp. DC300-4 TaxID=2804594 RepID=UPI003CF8322F
MNGTINRGGSPRRLGSPLAGRIAGAALTIFSLPIAGTALAEGPTAAPAPAGPRLTGTLGVASQHVSKGIGRSNGEASASGSIELSSNGFYGSLFASSAELSQGSDAELVTTLGYRTTIADFGLDVAVINRDFPGTRAGVDDNITEYQADLSGEVGPVSTRFRVNYSADGFASTKEAWWVEFQGGIALDDYTKATAAVGNRTADGGAEYAAWNVGVKRKLPHDLALDVRWYDTDGHSYGDAYEGRLVAALTYSF